MDKQFWHDRWEKNEIAFHEGAVNPLLEKHVEQLNLSNGSRIFLPLCGKTIDIVWLISQGFKVVGVELSEKAINELFKELGIVPKIGITEKLTHYQADNIDIFVGDFFDLSIEQLGGVDGIYDRAALVALPEDIRQRYVEHMMKITHVASQLLICFEYDQMELAGPPFSINTQYVKQYYAEMYQLKQLECKSLEGRFKGRVSAVETIWLLRNLTN
jgi:thiopurine S-methyltransferase